MPSALLASAQKELSGQSRDLTRLVKQVKGILPQYSDDNICEALIQCDEDIDRSVELLLNTPLVARAGKKKKERKDRQAEHGVDTADGRTGIEATAAGNEGWGDCGDEAGGEARGGGDAKEVLPDMIDEVPRDDRPKTEAEKCAGKLRKKLREIERIEERLARSQKVDPLQLPKIEKKSEVEYELMLAEQKVHEEERQRQEEQRLREEEERRQREEEERQERARQEERRRLEVQRREEERLQALRAEQSAREQREREARERAAHEAAELEASRRHRPTAFKAPPAAPPLQAQNSQPQSQPGEPKQAMGAQLLSMLHTGEAQQNNRYEESRRMAEKLKQSAGSKVLEGHGGQGGFGGQGGRSGGYASRNNDREAGGNDGTAAPPERGPGGPGYALKSRIFQQDWAHEEDDEEEAPQTSFTNQYSTPLDASRITPEQRAEAERIAKEIEGKGGNNRESYRRSGKGQNWKGGSDRRGGNNKGGGRDSGSWTTWKHSSRQ